MPHTKAITKFGAHCGDRIAHPPAQLVMGISEDVERREFLQRITPEMHVGDGVKVAQDMKADHEAPRVAPLQRGQFPRQGAFQVRPVLIPDRPLHVVAVAGLPLAAGMRACGALLQRQAVDREAFPPALGNLAAPLALVAAGVEDVESGRRDAGREDGPAIDHCWMILRQRLLLAVLELEAEDAGFPGYGAGRLSHDPRDAAYPAAM